MAQIALPDQDSSTESRTRRTRLRWRVSLAAAVLTILLVIGLCWVFRRPWFQGNLGVVDAGRVIRSAQPTSQLPEWIRDHRLRSILNLRGGGPDDWWYDAEIKAAEAGGVTFYDFPLNATRRRCATSCSSSSTPSVPARTPS